jgi:hypothetical protein
MRTLLLVSGASMTGSPKRRSDDTLDHHEANATTGPLVVPGAAVGTTMRAALPGRRPSDPSVADEASRNQGRNTPVVGAEPAAVRPKSIAAGRVASVIKSRSTAVGWRGSRW